MNNHTYVIKLLDVDEQFADQRARNLVDNLREIEGVIEAKRSKDDEGTMDLGSILTIVAASGATTALSQGLADWLRSRRSSKVIIEKDFRTQSIKATVEMVDPDTAKQIVELIQGSK